MGVKGRENSFFQEIREDRVSAGRQKIINQRDFRLIRRGTDKFVFRWESREIFDFVTLVAKEKFKRGNRRGKQTFNNKGRTSRAARPANSNLAGIPLFRQPVSNLFFFDMEGGAVNNQKRSLHIFGFVSNKRKGVITIGI